MRKFSSFVRFLSPRTTSDLGPSSRLKPVTSLRVSAIRLSIVERSKEGSFMRSSREEVR